MIQIIAKIFFKSLSLDVYLEKSYFLLRCPLWLCSSFKQGKNESDGEDGLFKTPLEQTRTLEMTQLRNLTCKTLAEEMIVLVVLASKW